MKIEENKRLSNIKNIFLFTEFVLCVLSILIFMHTINTNDLSKLNIDNGVIVIVHILISIFILLLSIAFNIISKKIINIFLTTELFKMIH